METAYEATFIVDTHLADDQVIGVIDKYSGVITRGGGTIDDVDRWEPRRLAYEIKGQREGVYLIVNFRSEPAAKDELDRIFRISDDVLRHIIIKQDQDADRAPGKTRSTENERREREQAARQAAYPTPSASGPALVTELGGGNGSAPAPPTATADDTGLVAEATPEVPDPAAAVRAGLPPVPAYAETADAEDPLAHQPTASTDTADAQPEAKQQPQAAGAPDAAPAPDAAGGSAPDEEATGTNANIA